MEKKDNQPLVSIVMATFNEPVNYVKESVESICHQTYSHLELLICDDSTRQETIAAIDEMAKADSRVIVIRKKERMGFVNALNTGLERAKGEFIARMDADDIALPDRIEKQVRFANSNPTVDLFGGHVYIINEKGDIISRRRYKTTPKAFERMFIYRNPLAHPTIMFRRKIVDDGFRYDPNFKKAEDLNLYLHLYKNGYKLSNVNEFLLKYRVLTNQQRKRKRDNWSYNHKARCIFIWQKPLFSLLSWSISLCYQFVPGRVVNYIYKLENNDYNMARMKVD